MVRILSSHDDNHVLNFEQDDIPPATIDPGTRNTLTNLWAQRISIEDTLNKLLDSGLDVDIEDEYYTLEKQHNVINRKMFDVYRLSTFLVHANNIRKYPPRTLITNASVAQDETPPSVRTSMGELEKQETRKATRRSTLNSKGAQPETQIKSTSDSPPKIEAQPHENSVGTWLLETISKRKAAQKTTATRPPSQTTLDDFYLQEDNENDDEPEPKRTMSEKNAFTTSVQERDDYNAETINLIDETMDMFREEIPGSIAMIVDSGTSHILLRQEHAHVLQNVICNTSRSYATITCAKQGAKITAIGTRSLTIGRFRLQAFICRDNELQHSLLGLNPLTERGCTAEFTDRFVKLHHTACLQSVLAGYKYLRPTL